MKFKNFFSIVLLFNVLILISSNQISAQDRQRIVNEGENKKTETNQPKTTPNPAPRRVLTDEINVKPAPQKPLVKKTVSSESASKDQSVANNNAGNLPLALFNQRMLTEMKSRLGVPYRMGTTGPNRYDCSGLVWSVFQSAGLSFTRTSARTYYNTFEPVYGDERYEFGTLVFFNGLGHVGIVIDDKTFFHASYSKGVTFSSFAGYWEKRIVGFRRIPMN